MAVARRCDRCGRCFDPLDTLGHMARFRNPVFQTSAQIRSTTIGSYLLDAPSDTLVDLCPICTKKFKEFMNTADWKESEE